jgi:Na+-translocating ferredoxin:NAD+ oxidoreductase subunit D
MTRSFATGAAPHWAPARSVRRLMAWVLLALLPGTAVQTWFFGAGVLWQVLLAIGFAVGFEAALLRLRGRPLRPFVTDLSAPVSGALFALCLPPLAPWWIAASGMAAAMLFAKHLYGGLGFNLFNPAMVGYAVVLVCFPLEASRWPAPHAVDALEAARAIFSGQLPPARWDAIAQATPLDTTRALLRAGATLGEIAGDAAYLRAAPQAWGWVVLAHALGGLLLLWRGVIRWQVPLAALATTVLATLPFWLWDADLHASPLQHLGRGALVFAAFFIATDPVSGCTTPRGWLVFGAGVALLTLAIRHWGVYPDGVAFAVLLMNCAAPWIDLHTVPRIHGRSRT